MLAPWKKSYEQPRQHIQSKDITLPTKVRLVKSMVFTVVMYGCESWTVKKAERRRIDAFELWCWIRLLRVPWTARRSNQSILKEISPGNSFLFFGGVGGFNLFIERMWRKGNPLTVLVGMQTSTATLENSVESP